jgi:hypothetical protein
LLRASVLAVETPKQLDAVTLSVPVVNPAANCTLILFVPCPLVIVALDGAVHT